MEASQIERPPNGALIHRLKSTKWNKMAVSLSCLVFVVITQAFLQSAEAQIKYTVTRLVPITGVSSSPGGLNAQGDVVGNYHWRDGALHVFLNHAGVMHDIAELAGSTPTGINIYGRIIGYNLANVGPYTYFEKRAWSLSGTIPNLKAVAVNTASHIACASQFSGSFIWQKSGITPLPAPHKATYPFFAAAINNSDQVAGTALVDVYHAFLISGGQAIDLGTLQNEPNLSSFASAVNDQGQVAGASVVSWGEGKGGGKHAFIYSGGKLQDIQTNATYLESFAFGINNSGHVAGKFTDSQGNERAFVYDGSQMIDLDRYLHHSGQASNAEKQPTGRGPEG